MIDRVDFERQPFGEPLRKLRIVGFHAARHDADGGPAVDLLEPIQDRTQIRFVLRRLAHVVDRQDDNALDSFFANPLRRDEPGKIAVRIPGVVFVEIRQAIAVTRSRR